jgi:PKD repeat protein
MFTNGSTYYTGIKAVNFAGLTGNTIWSDGETYLAPPVAAFNANVTGICTGESVSFTNNSINATDYSWTFYGGTPNFSNEPNPVVTYLNPGTYSVQLSVSGTSGSDELILENYIHVIDPPVAEFSWVGESTNETVYFTNTSSNATSYFWNFGDGNTSTETNPTHIFTDDGNYTISLTASNNFCPSDVSSENLVITLLPKYFMQSTLVKIIPNPNNGVFTVFFNRPINDILEITDITGRIIWKQNCTNKQKEITLSDAIPGIYFLQLKQNGIISKFIIQ